MKNRSAVTGKAVSDAYAKANKSTTVKEGKSKDTLRLDWLQRNRAEVNFSKGFWVESATGNGHGGGASLRKAIDAAMEAVRS